MGVPTGLPVPSAVLAVEAAAVAVGEEEVAMVVPGRTTTPLAPVVQVPVVPPAAHAVPGGVHGATVFHAVGLEMVPRPPSGPTLPAVTAVGDGAVVRGVGPKTGPAGPVVTFPARPALATVGPDAPDSYRA